MTKITLGGEEINTVGSLPAVGETISRFELVDQNLGEITQADFEGKKVVFNIFPSLDTGICATSVRQFNKMVAELPDTVVLCVSKDLPFALERFCGAEGINNAVTASAFRSTFGEDFGVTMTDGPLRGLLSRAVIVVDRDGTVAYSQQVPEIKTEPDYEGARAAVEALA